MRRSRAAPTGFAMKQLVTYEGMHCANCGTPVQGEFCHVCGQSVHSVLKPLHGLLEDALDIVSPIDGRVVHTIPPLFMRPGFLTLEYFAGRRKRYVAPFRLMFALCLLAFFVTQIVFDPDVVMDQPATATVTVPAFAQAHTADEVQRALQHQLDELDASQAAGKQVIAARAIGLAKRSLREQAELRLHELETKPASPGKTTDPSALAQAADPLDAMWDPQHHPVAISWLPDFANRHLQVMAVQLHANIDALSSDDPAIKTRAIERFKAGAFGVLPQTMFVLMPIFALLLKLLYLFRRLLYIEHLIVVLHSHAFLFLSLLLGTGIYLLSTWLTPYAGWIHTPLHWLIVGLCIWAPIYLLIMQKRIYRQGWPMTILKYWVIGWCYSWLLGMALGVAGLFGFVS